MIVYELDLDSIERQHSNGIFVHIKQLQEIHSQKRKKPNPMRVCARLTEFVFRYIPLASCEPSHGNVYHQFHSRSHHIDETCLCRKRLHAFHRVHHHKDRRTPIYRG